MRHKAVYVRWLDHAGTNGDPKKMKPFVRHTVGWLVKENSRYVILAMDHCRVGREYGYLILRGDILKMRRLVRK